MINNENFKKKKKRTKRLPDFTVCFRPYEVFRLRLKKLPKRVFYRWSKKRFNNFKEEHDRRTARDFNNEKHFSLKRDGFFLSLLKLNINVVFYIIFPICILLLCYLWWGVANKFNVRYYLWRWNRAVPKKYRLGYIPFLWLMYYYFSPFLFVLKLVTFVPLFIGNLFVLWYVNLNTNWNNYMERKLISLIIWRLGLGLIPSLPIMFNAYFFWGNGYHLEFYKNIFIVVPSFLFREIWAIWKIIKPAIVPLVVSIFNIFK